MSGINRIRMHSERGNYDRDTLYNILDQSLICHIAFADGGQVFNIPMVFARRGDSVYLHSSVKSRIYGVLSSGTGLCMTSTVIDGIVVAKSAFHSSMNYRSAMVFGKALPVTGEQEKISAAGAITEKMISGRWDDCRLPNKSELKTTGFLRLDLEKFSCKIREGDPVEDPADLELPYWSGVIPVSVEKGYPKTAESNGIQAEIPQYLKNQKS